MGATAAISLSLMIGEAALALVVVVTTEPGGRDPSGSPVFAALAGRIRDKSVNSAMQTARKFVRRNREWFPMVPSRRVSRWGKLERYRGVTGAARAPLGVKVNSSDTLAECADGMICGYCGWALDAAGDFCRATGDTHTLAVCRDELARQLRDARRIVPVCFDCLRPVPQHASWCHWGRR